METMQDQINTAASSQYSSRTNLGSWYDLADVSQIPLRGSRCVDIGANKIAVFKTAAETLHAIENRCPHRNGPLSEGIVHGDCVTCPLHNWVVSLADGQAQGADIGQVKVFPLRLVGSRIQVFVDT